MDNPPRILFIGSVTFEETSGSHTIFYRLFKNYPSDCLLVIGSHKSRNPSFPTKRLPKVTYFLTEQLGLPIFRLRIAKHLPFIRRFHSYISILELFSSFFKIKRIAKSFKPDIILTLTMDVHWYLAYRLSMSMDIPLDVVLHDKLEWFIPQRLQPFFEEQFKRVYTQARNRFCISPTMEQFYYKRMGIHAEVSYPIGTANKVNFLNKPNNINPTIVFFGNIWLPQPTIIELAHLLDKKRGNITLFSNRDLSFFRRHGLRTGNLVANSFRKNEDLLKWCNQYADILYLPMYFDENEKDMVECSFPSKLIDYLSLGLPIIIHAPANSSIVEFAKMNKDLPFAEIVVSNDKKKLEACLCKLLDLEYRQQLGHNATKVWDKYFAPEVVRQAFFEKILSA